MANEITVTIGINVSKGYLKHNLATTSQQLTLTGTHDYSNTQDIGTTEEALELGTNLGTPGVAYFTNTDTTNFVTIGVKPAATYYPLLKIKAGETWPVRLDNVAFYAKADTATVKLKYYILED